MLLPVLVLAFALLFATRALAIHLARRSSSADEAVAGIAKLELVPLNTLGEALRSVKSFWRVLVSRPGTPIGLLAGMHLLLWLSFIATVVAGIATTSNL